MLWKGADLGKQFPEFAYGEPIKLAEWFGCIVLLDHVPKLRIESRKAHVVFTPPP